MSTVLKRYTQISFKHGDQELVDKVFVDPSAPEPEHKAEVEAKIAEINAIFGVTQFTITSTYSYEVEFVDATLSETPAEVVV